MGRRVNLFNEFSKNLKSNPEIIEKIVPEKISDKLIETINYRYVEGLERYFEECKDPRDFDEFKDRFRYESNPFPHDSKRQYIIKNNFPNKAVKIANDIMWDFLYFFAFSISMHFANYSIGDIENGKCSKNITMDNFIKNYLDL